MNKKGHIPTVILFLGSLILIVSALVILTHNGSRWTIESKDFVSLESSARVRSDYVQAVFGYLVEKAANESSNEREFRDNLALLSKERSWNLEASQDLQDKLWNENYILESNEGIYVITLDDVEVTTTVKNNFAITRVDLNESFELSG